MNYQTNWQEKAKRLPDEIFSRLEQTDKTNVLKRALLLGRGTEFFTTNTKFLIPAVWKLFVSSSNLKPANPVPTDENLIYLKGEPFERLTSFPDKVFDLIISLWDLSLQNEHNASYINNIYRLLKNNGQFSIITHLDGSPELPLDIIKKTILKAKLPLKIFKSALPDSTGNFRKMLNKTGLCDVRIWKDNISCIYESPETLYSDIFSDKEENIFAENTTNEQHIIIKTEFIREISTYSFPLEINYGFAGGVGVKP